MFSYGPLDVLTAETSLCSTKEQSMEVEALLLLSPLFFCLEVAQLSGVSFGKSSPFFYLETAAEDVVRKAQSYKGDSRRMVRKRNDKLIRERAWRKYEKMEVKGLCGRGKQYIFTAVSCGKKEVTDRWGGKGR